MLSRLAVRAALAAVALTGCQTAEHAAFRPAATELGQVHWQRAQTSVTADVAFQPGANDSIRLVVNKGETLLTLTGATGGWTATGPLAGAGWRGSADRAPGPLAGWIALAEAFQRAVRAPGRDREIKTARFSARYHSSAGRLSALDVVCHDTDDRFAARF